MDPQTLKTALAAAVDDVEWSWLKPHLERDGLILVARELDLVVVAAEIAGNNSAQVQKWMESGLLSKPDAGRIKYWNENPESPFKSLIVQPYVLIQEKLPH